MSRFRRQTSNNNLLAHDEEPKENTISKNHLKIPRTRLYNSNHVRHAIFSFNHVRLYLISSPVKIGVPNLLVKFLSTSHMELSVKLSQPLTANRTPYAMLCDAIWRGVVWCGYVRLWLLWAACIQLTAREEQG